MMIFDGHLDLAMNALRHERDLRLEVAQVRERERDGVADERGVCTVTLPELRRAGVAVVISTVLARCKPWIDPSRTIIRDSIDYPDPTMSYAIAQGELAYYRLLERQGELRIIETVTALDEHLRQWEAGESTAMGVILTMEGADPLVEPRQLHQWHAQGLRTLTLAHYGQSRYAAGTPSDDGQNTRDVDGPVTDLGIALLLEMSKLNMPLDLTHTSDQSFFMAIDAYNGPIYSSHTNCRRLSGGVRQFTDEQIRCITRRGGVLGVAAHYAMIEGGWPSNVKPKDVTLDRLIDHVEHICQLTGDAAHVAIGSDLDGGFGAEHTPRGLDTIADLSKLAPLLRGRGFTDDDVAGFFYANWLQFWRGALPVQ